MQETEREQAQSRLYATIVAKIIGGEVAPGSRLIEEDLAREHEVSRTPVREVLIALERDGLVERIPHRGARVVSFTADDVEEIFEIRRVLECYCIPSVIRNAKLGVLLEFDSRLEELKASPPVAMRETQAAVDFELHRMFVELSGNRRLISYMQTIGRLLQCLQWMSYRRDVQIQATGEEHQAIVRALLRRDAELAQRLLSEHIEHGKRNVLELFLTRSETGRRTARA